MTSSSAGLFVAILLGVCLALPKTAQAHNGPPFPIIVDQTIPGYLVNVLANPDTSQSVFFVVLEPRPHAAAPAISSVDITIQPMSGRLPPATYHATLDSTARNFRYFASPEFDQPETWKTKVEIRLADGSNSFFETQVEATPPGIGRWGFVVYLFPFVLFGGLWVLVFVRKSKSARRAKGAEYPLPQYIPSSPPISSDTPPLSDKGADL